MPIVLASCRAHRGAFQSSRSGANDDHIFIDIDTDLIQEGFDVLHADASRFKGMVYSHWPETLRMAATHGGERVGNFVRFKFTTSDAVVAWNCRWLWFLVSQLDWNGVSRPRLDEMVDKWSRRPLHQDGLAPADAVCAAARASTASRRILYSHADPRFDEMFPKLTLNKTVDRTLYGRSTSDLQCMLTLQGPIQDDWVAQAERLYAAALARSGGERASWSPVTRN